MCKLKSCIVLKDRIFCPDYDSHDKMLSELKIKDTRENAERLFVRVELSPIDDDVFSPINTWRMKVDQDIRPEWFLEETERPRVVEAVKEWAKEHVFCGENDLILNSGVYYLNNSSAELWGNSSAELYGNSSAELYDNSSAKLYGNSSAELYDNSSAKLYDNSSAKLYDNSSAKLYGNSSATLWGNSMGIIPESIFSGKYKNYILMDNATLKDCSQKTIYQAGGWRVVEAQGDEKSE